MENYSVVIPALFFEELGLNPPESVHAVDAVTTHYSIDQYGFLDDMPHYQYLFFVVTILHLQLS